LTLTLCPTPIGLGETLMKEYVGNCHGGSCALAAGKATSETAIVNIRNKEITVAIALFFEKCIFPSPYFYFAIYIAINLLC
jgi:hypothetical protein